MVDLFDMKLKVVSNQHNVNNIIILKQIIKAMDLKKSKNIPKPTHFGENLKYLRRLNGLSQTELANQLGLNRNNIASYESGMVEPNTKIFLKTCTYFGVESKNMLAFKLSEKPIDDLAAVVVTSSEKPIDIYLKDQLDAFTKQTNEMTKIYEGYKALLQLRKVDNNQETGPLYSTLEDLIEILNNLISSNWQLIQSLYPTGDVNESNADVQKPE